MLPELVGQDRSAFISVLKACKQLGAIGRVHSVHDSIIKRGFELDIAIGNILVDVYAKCGSIEDAHGAFDLLPYRNVVAWGALITGYAAYGKAEPALTLFERMHQEGIEPDGVALVSLLKACGSTTEIGKIRMIHDQAIRYRCECDVFIGSTLVDIYSRHGCVLEAHQIFKGMSNPNAVSWVAIIAGYAQNGIDNIGLELLDKMQQESIEVDRVACLSILKACGRLRALRQGRLIHGQALKGALCLEIAVGNALIDMYARCGSIDEAHEVFKGLQSRDVVSWGAIMTGYAGNGFGKVALELFDKMQHIDIVPNTIILLAVVKACTISGCSEHGCSTHGEIIKRGFESDLNIGNSLVDMYAKWGKLEDAEHIFSMLSYQDAASWGAIILGCVLHGEGSLALKLYGQMQRDNKEPDKVIFLCVLQACGTTGALEQGRLVHGQIIQGKLEFDIGIGNTLVDMYAKCGAAAEAQRVFDGLPSQNAVSWAAVITAYAKSGSFRLADKCIKKMQQQGLKLHDGIFTSILVACCHAGVPGEGCHYFKMMVDDHDIVPNIEHYNCIIDLLGRSGRLEEASAVLATMPVPPDVIVWTSLLTNCKTYHNVELGRNCLNKVVEQNPDDASAYILMSKIFADADMWEDVNKLLELRKSLGAEKKRGITSVEVHNTIYEFIVGENSHEQMVCSSYKLKRLSVLSKQAGHMPQLDALLGPLVNEYEDAL